METEGNWEVGGVRENVGSGVPASFVVFVEPSPASKSRGVDMNAFAFPYGMPGPPKSNIAHPDLRVRRQQQHNNQTGRVSKRAANHVTKLATLLI